MKKTRRKRRYEKKRSPLQHLHQLRPHPNIHNTPNPISRHNLAHPRKRTGDIIPPNAWESLGPEIQPTRRLAVIQIQTQQVHGCTDELHQRGTRELRHGGFHAGGRGERVGDFRGDVGGDVEGGEDGDAVAEAEEGVGDFGDLFDGWVAG